MKWWPITLISLGVMCAFAVAFFAFGNKEYTAVDVPGLNDGQLIQFECLRHAEDSQTDFDKRVQEAGSFFRAAVQVALKDAATEMADAIRNKSGASAAEQLRGADETLNDNLEKAAKNLRTLYDCDFISM